MTNSCKKKNFLGIDWGKSRVGLSLADEETKIAFAYGTLGNDKNLIDKLVKIINEEGIETIIIGIPSYVNRKEVKYDGEKLGELLFFVMPNLKIEYQNEMFTTKMAHEKLIEKGVRDIKTQDDQEAARIILQEWLDEKQKDQKN